MNIIVAMIFGLKRAPECITMHHFEGEHAKIFLRRGHTPQSPPSSAPSAPPLDCLRHSTPLLQTIFLDTGLHAVLRVAPTDTIQILETEQRIAALIVLQASIKGDPVASHCRTSCIG